MFTFHPMDERHPCTFTDWELQALPGVVRLPAGQAPDLFHYRAGGIVWVVGRSGDLWVRAPAPREPGA